MLGLLVPNLVLGFGMAVLFGMLVGASMRDVPPQRYGMAGAGRTTVFQLALALGVAVGVAIIGSPDTADEALAVHRAAWLASAGALALLSRDLPGRLPQRRGRGEP